MTDSERTAAEMRSIMRFALGLGLTRQTVTSIYETVGREAKAAGVGDDDRMAEVRKRILGAADRACDSPCGDAGRCSPAEE